MTDKSKEMAKGEKMVSNVIKERQRDLLLSLRSKLVGQNHTLPYTIYKDEEIENLLAKQPHTIEELSQVKGFPDGGKRLKGFGEAILEVFNHTSKVKDLDVKYVKGAIEVVTVLRKMELF